MQKNASTITPTLILTLMLTSFTILSGLVLSSSIVSADNDSTVDEVNITVPVSCTLSGTGQNSHNAEINNGQYNSAIGETTMKAFCNDNNGFAIYAIGYTDNEDGKNVLTNPTLGSTYDIETGTAITGNDSQWAMKLSTITSPTPTYPIIIAGSTDDADKEQGDPDYSTFQEVPDDYTLVAKRTSGTDTGASTEGATLKSTYQAYISKTQPAGTYTGQVKYTLVHPSSSMPDIPAPTPTCEPEPGHICYDANARPRDIEGTMDAQALDKAKDWSVCYETDYATYCSDSDWNDVDINTLPELDTYTDPTLHASNFKRKGYGFAGWNDKADLSGTNYGPNQTIPVTEDMIDNGITLYAHWVESSGNLQNWTGCNALSQNQVIGLTDTRDGNVYAVAKLADDNCWMIENLRLADKDSNNNPIILNSTNTNNPAPSFTVLSASSNNWCGVYNETCVNQNKLNTDNTTLFITNTTGTQDSNIYSYGNYYNWYAATAGTGTYSQTSGNATGDICPNGWSLPTGGRNGQISSLDINMGGNGQTEYESSEASSRWRSYPNNYIYSAAWVDSAMANRGIGDYWTRTANNSYGAFSLSLSSMSSFPGTAGVFKGGGPTIRCLTQ